MVEDSPVERVTADRSRHPPADDTRLTSFLTLSPRIARVTPQVGPFMFQVATHLAY